MAHFGPHPSLALARDPADPVWRWFILNGPHGARFQWHREVAWTSDVDLLAAFIVGRDDQSHGFALRAREVALEALTTEEAILIRTGIRVLTILGTPSDLAQSGRLDSHPDPLVARDARCSLFERKHRDFAIGERVRDQLEDAARVTTAAVDPQCT